MPPRPEMTDEIADHRLGRCLDGCNELLDRVGPATVGDEYRVVAGNDDHVVHANNAHLGADGADVGPVDIDEDSIPCDDVARLSFFAASHTGRPRT